MRSAPGAGSNARTTLIQDDKRTLEDQGESKKRTLEEPGSGVQIGARPQELRKAHSHLLNVLGVLPKSFNINSATLKCDEAESFLPSDKRRVKEMISLSQTNRNG